MVLKCDKTYYDRRQLTTHIASIHDQLKEYACNLCSKRFNAKEGLTRHVKHFHEKSKASICTLCNKTLSRASSLQYHIESAENTFRMTRCNRLDPLLWYVFALFEIRTNFLALMSYVIRKVIFRTKQFKKKNDLLTKYYIL